MKYNKSIEYSENTSSISPDILEQIKKRTEEMSTSEASIRKLLNLSTPTNLTNPQIKLTTNIRNNKKNTFLLPGLKNKRASVSNDYDFFPQKLFPNSNNNILSRNKKISFTNNIFSINDYKRIFEKTEKEILEKQEKLRLKKILDKIDKNTDEIISQSNSTKFDKFKTKNNLRKHRLDKSLSYNEIWEKVKKGKSFLQKKEKDIDIDFIKFIPKEKTLEKCNIIRLLNFNNKNKKEKIKKYISLKNIQINSIDNMIKKLENSKEMLGNKYGEEFKSYILFLNKAYDKESMKNDDLINEKNIILNEIKKLKRQIERIKNKKQKIIDWLFLQIQVIERKIKLPIYYKYIIEDNIPFEQINAISRGNYNLNLNEYNKILNYKKHCIYESEENLLKDLDNIEIKSLNKLNENSKLIKRNNDLKDELEELKFQNIKIEKLYNENYKQIIDKLAFVKKENEKMERQFIQLKTKKFINKTYQDDALYRKLLIFSNKYRNKKMVKFIQRNDKPLIYYLTIILYSILNMRKYPELSHKKILFNPELSEKQKMLLIFQFAEDCVNLINKEKNNYLSNNKMAEEYRRIKLEREKDSKKERLDIKVEIQKKIEDEKIEKLKDKISKKYFKNIRRIDFEHYKKEKAIKNKSLDIDIKKQTQLNDFFYDIDS